MAARARAAARTMAGQGTPVRYLASLLLPGDETCFHLFDAPSSGAAAEAGARAGVRAGRVLEAVAVLAEDGPSAGSIGVEGERGHRVGQSRPRIRKEVPR